jgi:hypothetical protein
MSEIWAGRVAGRQLRNRQRDPLSYHFTQAVGIGALIGSTFAGEPALAVLGAALLGLPAVLALRQPEAANPTISVDKVYADGTRIKAVVPDDGLPRRTAFERHRLRQMFLNSDEYACIAAVEYEAALDALLWPTPAPEGERIAKGYKVWDNHTKRWVVKD